jgi:uncharacterized protein (DUF1501 family)
MADQIARAEGGMPALCVGEAELPLALVGEHVAPPTLLDESSLRLQSLPGLKQERDALLETRPESEDLAFLRASARSAYEAAHRLTNALERAPSADYPDLELARRLRLVSRLIAGGFDTRIFHLQLGGFDTHARQASTHAALLQELGRSLAAFERDLLRSGNAGRVMTVVHSEFGRRVEENGSRGTDHGAAAPVMLLGGPAHGGLIGPSPELEGLVEGDIQFTTDFRSLYRMIEEEWMGLVSLLDFAPLRLR